MNSAELDALNDLLYNKQTHAFLEATLEPSLVLTGVDSRDCSVLHAAAIVEDTGAVIFERVCARGVDVNLRDAYGNTPLMTAVNYRCLNNARSLIALGADIHLFSDELKSALKIACANGDLACATLLLDAGAHVDADGGNLVSPLHLATENACSLPMIELLLARGANIDFGSGRGTAIMGAISMEDAALVRFFLDRGADIVAPKNRNGETTLEFAGRVGNESILAMLREHLQRPTRTTT